MVAEHTEKRGRVKELLRRFCQAYFNRFVLRFAGRARSLCAIVQHVGRCSGTEYRNPVLAYRAGRWFVIGLPYGEECNWCQNVLASGGCTIMWRGDEYRATAPRVLRLDIVAQRLPRRHQAILSMMGVKRYLMMKASEPIELAAS